MRYISLDQQLGTGLLLGRDIYTDEGNVLVRSGTKLSSAMIAKMMQLGIPGLFILDAQQPDYDEKELIAAKTKDEAILKLLEVYNQVQKKGDLDVKVISQIAQMLVDEGIYNGEILSMIPDIRTPKNELAVHSVSVSILAILLARKSNVPPIRLKDVAIGALLHDIGKILPDDPQLNRQGKSNDHTWKGFEFLRKKFEISLLSAHICLQHHEHIDGSGIPRGTSGSEIPLFSQLVAISNHYDRLIYGYEERNTITPQDAYEEMMGLADKKFSMELVHTFLHTIPIYPVGTYVQLNTGEVGLITKLNKGLPTRPVVLVKSSLSEFEGDQSGNVIDLSLATTVFIDEIIPK